MNIDWRRRMAASRREMLGLISTADREIVGIYHRAAEDLARKARDARAGGLTERWLTDYSRSLTDTIGQMRLDIYGIAQDAVERSAQIPAKATRDWMARAVEASGMSVDKTFTAVLSHAPTDAIRAIIEGRMYRDGVSLSRRIWNNTGRLQHSIEDVITQGLAQQASLPEISRALEQYLNPDERAPIDIRRLYPNMGEPARGGQPIPRTYQVEYNSLRLARTAINHAYWGANKAAAKLNPLCQGMLWILSADHFTRQIAKFGPDVCDEYVKHDEGLGVGVYPVDKLPLPHPQCLCRQEQVLPTTDEAVDRLNRWLAGGSDPALEQGYQRAQRMAGGKATVSTGAAKKQLTFAQEMKRRDQHAQRYYESVRNRQHDAATIARNTGWKESAVEAVRQHVFVQEHTLADGVMRFAPDYDQAEAWRRLLEGKDIKDSDIVFLRHEFVELTQMRLRGLTYDEAHAIANRQHNWYNLVREEV